MPPQLPPPPPRPSLFNVERSSSPPSCEDDVPVACEGLELTVYALDRTTPRSAADHLRRILLGLKEGSRRDPTCDALYDAVVVRSADVDKCFDYAYVSLNRERVPQPRADLLQDLRKTLIDSNPTLRVLWRTQSGPDRTRRAFFTFDSKAHAQQVKPGLDEWMRKKGYTYYADYISKPFGPWRVTFDFIDPAHVDALMDSPPIVEGDKCVTRRPRFITPSYGYQVALLNCRDWSSAQSILDSWVRRLFLEDPTDPVVYSAMELEGDVYTVVLPSWAHVIKVIDGYHDLEAYLEQNPVTRHVVRTPQPGLLYCLNGVGLAINRSGSGDSSSSSSSQEFAQLRREFEHTRLQGAEMLGTVFHISTQNTEAITRLSGQMEAVRANSTALAMSQSLSNQLLDLNMSLADARREQSHSEMILLQRDLPSNVSDYHLQSTRRREEQIREYADEKKRLQAEIAAVHHALSASLPSLVTAMTAARQVQPAAASSAQPTPPGLAVPQPRPRRSSTESVEEAMEEQ